jgi:hypothetical protein
MSQMKINKQVFCNSRKSKCVTQWFFLCQIFSILWKTFCCKFLVFWSFFFAKQNFITNLWKSSQLPIMGKGVKKFLLSNLELPNLDKYIYGWLPFEKHQNFWEKINHVIKHESILQDWYVVYKTNNNFMAISITSAHTSFGSSVWKVWFSWRPCYKVFN